MLKLKLIPRFARLLSTGKGLSRNFASAASGGGSDDGDFFTQYLSEAPSPDEQSQHNRGFGRQGPGSGRDSFMGGGRGGSGFRGNRGGRGGFMGRGGRGGSGPGRRLFDERQPSAPVELSEEDIKLKQEIERKRAAQMQSNEEKMDEADEDDEENSEPRSIYAGFIDPKYDDVIKEHKMHLKRLRYKDKAIIPSKFEDEDKEEDLGYLDKVSSDDETSDQESDEDISGSEDEVDEEEWEAMNDMDNDEFEMYLKRRQQGKQLSKEYDARIKALGDKAEDIEEVKQVQKLMMKKWRAQYLMPRMVTPKEKEEMWQKHKENPDEWTIDKLADEYNVCKARVHAILFLWDIRKQGGESQTAEEETKVYLDSLGFDEWGKPCLPAHMGEDKWVTTWNTKPNYKIMPADWEGSVRTEEEAIEEASAKEEAMMLEEFIRRLEFNKLQMAGIMKQQKHDRRRPPGGWTYLVEKLGPEGKRGKRGGFKFVATADGKHRKLNDLEKLVLKREAVRPRKRILS